MPNISYCTEKNTKFRSLLLWKHAIWRTGHSIVYLKLEHGTNLKVQKIEKMLKHETASRWLYIWGNIQETSIAPLKLLTAQQWPLVPPMSSIGSCRLSNHEHIEHFGVWTKWTKWWHFQWHFLERKLHTLDLKLKVVCSERYNFCCLNCHKVKTKITSPITHLMYVN